MLFCIAYETDYLLFPPVAVNTLPWWNYISCSKNSTRNEKLAGKRESRVRDSSQ